MSIGHYGLLLKEGPSVNDSVGSIALMIVDRQVNKTSEAPAVDPGLMASIVLSCEIVFFKKNSCSASTDVARSPVDWGFD